MDVLSSVSEQASRKLAIFASWTLYDLCRAEILRKFIFLATFIVGTTFVLLLLVDKYTVVAIFCSNGHSNGAILECKP